MDMEQGWGQVKERMDFIKARKAEALQAIQDGKDPEEVLNSFMMDLRNNPLTSNHLGLQLGVNFMIGGHLSRAGQIRDFIKGFN